MRRSLSSMLLYVVFLIAVNRCSSEYLRYDQENLGEIVGKSQFQVKLWSEIPPEYNVTEPPSGPDSGGVFLLGNTGYQTLDIIPLESLPTSMRIETSYWCHSKSSILKIFPVCTSDYEDIILPCEAKGWFTHTWERNCSIPVGLFYVEASGNNKAETEANGIEYIEIYTTEERTTSTMPMSTTPSQPTNYLRYDYDNFDEIVGGSSFEVIRWNEIPNEFSKEEPHDGVNTGGAFLLGNTHYQCFDQIVLDSKPTSIRIKASYWCHSAEDSDLRIYPTCNFEDKHLCQCRGWHVSTWELECNEQMQHPYHIEICGKSKGHNETMGLEFVEIYLDGATRRNN